jgi:hypothetical protein
MNRARGFSSAAAAAIAVFGTLALHGCSKDELSADKWTSQLDDKETEDNALQQLERLGSPSAIPELGKHWEKAGCTTRYMQLMIDLSRPLTPAEADAGNFIDPDVQKNGRPPSWDKSLPFLDEALKPAPPPSPDSPPNCNLDESSTRTVENASKAADALGQAQTPDAMNILVTALGQKYTAKTQSVRLAVIIALGKYKSDAALKALSDVLRQSPETQPVPLIGATANALAEMRSPGATEVLVETMFRVTPVFSQIRRALVASGPGVEGEMRKILLGQDENLNKIFTDNGLDKYCGDKDPATGKIAKPIDPCKPVAIREFYSAIILGDLYDPAAADDLITALGKPPVPAYYANGNPGPSQLNGIFDSLRKIGAPKGADVLLKIIVDTKGDIGERVLAVGAFPYVSRGTGLEDLRKIAADNQADDSLRQEAATAFARLGTSDKDIDAMLAISAQFKKAADEAAAKADTKYDAYKAAKDASDKAKSDLEAAKIKFQQEGGVKGAKVETIRAMSDAQKRADATDEPLDDARAVWKPLDDPARDYRRFQRMFEAEAARIEIYMHCKQDATCYAKALDAKPDEVVGRLKAYVKSLNNSLGTGKTDKDIRSHDDVWTEQDKKGLVIAEIERAMLELGKLGPAAADQTGTLLDHVKTEDRVTRQSIMLALPKVAKLPCTDCETKLDAVIKANQGKSELAELNVETMVLRNYFSWAGKTK